MIKLTHVAGPAGSPTLVLIPGGAGLSSLTLRSLDILSRSFSLVYVDLPGCNGATYTKDQTFEKLVEAMYEYTSKISGEIVLLGHSFGGYFAAALALGSHFAGLICISTPFSAAAYGSAVKRYESHMTDALKLAEERWESLQSDNTFVRWLSEYGELYFQADHLAAGQDLLLRDPACYQQFVHLQETHRKMESLLAPLSLWDGKKLFFAETQGLISTDALQIDAERGNFEFHAIPRASHFVMFDQPEAVARQIEAVFAATKKEEV